MTPRDETMVFEGAYGEGDGMRTLWIVDDDESVLGFLEIALATTFVVWACDHGPAALRRLRRDTPDVLLADLDLPVVTGEDLARYARTRAEPPFVCLMSADTERLSRACALADRIFPKPFDLGRLLTALTQIPCTCGR